MSVLYDGLNNDRIYNSHKKETNPFGRVQQRATVSKTRTTKMPNFYDNFSPPCEQLIHLTEKGGGDVREAHTAIMELTLIDGSYKGLQKLLQFPSSFCASVVLSERLS